jgi:1-acyl-sn-glycerol-3-phosphate acyltransferase
MARALERGAALLVYPGGDDETFRPSWESSTIDLAGRTGFIQLALKHNVPIAPVVAIGGQETGLFLGRGRAAARALGLGRFRLKVLPTVVGPPLGLTIWIYP